MSLLSSQQMSALLGLEVQTIRKMARDGRLPPHIKVGKAHRWRLEVVEQWLREQEQKNAR